MNRNADLVFEVLAFPIVMAVAQFRVLALIGGSAFLLLAYTDVEPVRVIIYGFISGSAIMLAIALTHFGGGFLGAVVIALAVVAMWKSEVIFNRVIPTSERIRLTAKIPIAIKQSVSGGIITVSISNESVHWLQSASIACQAFYANGHPVESLWTKTVSWGHWLAPGEGIARAEIANIYPNDPNRYDLSRTICSVAHADFRRMPPFIPSVRFEARHSGHNLFHITNDTPIAIRRLWFSCVGSNRFREAISTRPAYTENLDYQIAPGGSLTLMTSDRRYELTGCRIYAVETL
ncbi:hypothetical protein [Aurantimonas coralicida]|uniref:hypothetical protein n=1 Tax=Aurantimonas coralicida TaxID=182270 RepID=UPI001D18083A|nr:hypothetical protein [Aurantimonas coralicida]MCC4298320.1 hypothetical protein [Aurantimonas coralicida]